MVKLKFEYVHIKAWQMFPIIFHIVKIASNKCESINRNKNEVRVFKGNVSFVSILAKVSLYMYIPLFLSLDPSDFHICDSFMIC